MAEARDLDALKRRGRRRLVGAVALVLLAVIVLPMVFDPEPKRSAPPVSVRIPSEEDGGFAPKVTPKTPSASPAPKAVEPPKPEAPAPQAAAPQAAPAPQQPPAEPKSPQAERSRAEAALANVEYVFQVGAFSSPEKVKELTGRLAAEKLPYYTEAVATAKGKVTRVRAGPFASRQEAEKALARLKRLGLKPGNVVQKPG